MSLFSLLIFSITKNCPRMNGMYVPADHSTLVSSKNGMDATNRASSFTALPYSAPDTGQDGHSLLWWLQGPWLSG